MAMTELAPGSVFGGDGRFRLEQLLGTGGMASVWRATDAVLQRDVAIKVLSDSLALDSGYVKRFRREGRVAAGLSHPNLVRVFDLGQEGDRPFLVMEYVAGGTLADRLADGPPGVRHPEQLFAELLDALGYIHAAGIVHRDIKPANVLIGADGRARLTDFGIAQPTDATQITRTGMVVGTRRYIAPEIMRGTRADTRSDIYSCGVMFAQCLDDGAPEPLRALVAAMTAEDPAARPTPAAATALLSPPSPEGETTTRMPSLDTSAATLVRPVRTASEVIATPLRRGASMVAAARPGISHDGSHLRVPVPPRALLGAIVLVLVVVLVLALGSGGPSPAPRIPSPPSSSASLKQNLTYLDRAIGRARR